MSGLLLDTHAALFWWGASSKLGDTAREAIGAEDATILVSAATGWEIATKFRIGKLAFAGDPQVHLPRLMAQHHFETWDVRLDHGLLAGSLMGEHRDPFDRIIAAQALIDGLTVVTRDPHIAAFGCKVLW